ncbi:hypothetical protein HanRHA438_Chr10g0454711 [Helianthus annuus]|nr:hypothetical protein HanHA300_Chr10g0363851 [Helianthus annuus]KAJ0530086.1 hypothetical protein HanHA89_Chr10g0385571 [Helianthus annuus]KAJ0696942.1 hypothetical protein HanLR1_Chr10g0363091 [Helianthus annuus]KAJ0879714.1 hypothetical protein HanRHA438_Chr10g0454711 [Helianthus annuus]
MELNKFLYLPLCSYPNFIIAAITFSPSAPPSHLVTSRTAAIITYVPNSVCDHHWKLQQLHRSPSPISGHCCALLKLIVYAK